MLSGFLQSPEALAAAAHAARGLGRPDAADRLADLVEREARAA
jgi:UDP-N-acetylglucosamine:LPS N-acetylglucosamine transferase